MYKCANCGKTCLLETSRIDLPPDDRSDDVLIRTLKCQNCANCEIHTYEESRRGSLERECYDSNQYTISHALYEEIFKMISKCPSPENTHCDCAAHTTLGRKYINEMQGKLKWKVTGNPVLPFEIKVGGKLWQIQLNDFPEEEMFTLLIDGKKIRSFNEWPVDWSK